MTEAEKKLQAQKDQALKWASIAFAGSMIVTALASVRILRVNKRHLKFVKEIHAAQLANSEEMRNAISSLRAAGREFSYYPGIGVYLDKAYQY